MNGRLAIITTLTCLTLMFVTNRASAQFMLQSDGQTVQGSGVTIIQRKPELLRLQIELSAKGKTLKEALAKLKATREAAEAKLAKLEVPASEVKVSDPHINTAMSAQKRQMEMMVRQRMRQGGRKSAKAPAKQINVSSTLTAEWKLKPAEPEQMLINAYAIQEAVRAADLSGGAAEDDAAADEESAEEMAEMVGMYEDPNQPKPGEPFFMYVSKISKDDQSKAMAEAYAKARASAEQLTNATGAKLGALRGLSAQASPELAGREFAGFFGQHDPSRQYLMQLIASQSLTADDRLGEAIGSQPEEVRLPVHVTATFDLKNPE